METCNDALYILDTHHLLKVKSSWLILGIFFCLCSEGKECTLKEVDPDFEERVRANECGGRRSIFRRRRGAHTSAHTNEGTQSPQQCVLDEDNQSERPTHMFQRHRSSASKWTSAMPKSEEVDKTEVQYSILMSHYSNMIYTGTFRYRWFCNKSVLLYVRR
jgi:hypothetical protein